MDCKLVKLDMNDSIIKIYFLPLLFLEPGIMFRV